MKKTDFLSITQIVLDLSQADIFQHTILPKFPKKIGNILFGVGWGVGGGGRSAASSIKVKVNKQ